MLNLEFCLQVRYRPLFPNPLLLPASQPEEFAHVPIDGFLQVIFINNRMIFEKWKH